MSTNSTATARGLLGRKLGMTQVWDADNKVIPVTVIEADTNVVTQIRTRETDGYSAVQIGFGEIDGRKVNKPVSGHFAKAGVTPRRHIVEIRTELVADYTLGQEISPDDLRRRRRHRRHRDQQGQGLRRRHEASRLPRRGRLARRAPQPPQARLDRRLRHSGSRLQGSAHGRSHGRRAGHDAEPHGSRG